MRRFTVSEFATNASTRLAAWWSHMRRAERMGGRSAFTGEGSRSSDTYEWVSLQR